MGKGWGKGVLVRTWAPTPREKEHRRILSILVSGTTGCCADVGRPGQGGEKGPGPQPETMAAWMRV